MPKWGPARQGQRSWTAGDQGNDDVMRNLEYTRLLICMSHQRTAPRPSLVWPPASPPAPRWCGGSARRRRRLPSPPPPQRSTARSDIQRPRGRPLSPGTGSSLSDPRERCCASPRVSKDAGRAAGPCAGNPGRGAGYAVSRCVITLTICPVAVCL